MNKPFPPSLVLKPALLVAALFAIAPIAHAEKVLVQPGEIGRVMNSALPRPVIAGSYMLVASPNGSDDKNVGGACLVFQEVARVRACSSNADCMPKSTSAAGKGADIPANWHGYCALSVPRASACWYRPGPQPAFCDVGRTLVRDQKMRVPAAGFVDVHPAQVGRQPVRWRVITCQNLTPGGCAGAASVEGVDKRTLYGRSSVLTP
jgi:hypothetical protein